MAITSTNEGINGSTTVYMKTDPTRLYKLGGLAAILIVATALLEIIITFLPGGYASTDTVKDWFTLLQNNWFLGLQNLGLLNIVMTMLGIPMFFVLYTALRDIDPSMAALAFIISLVGVAVFYATNRAFAMLDLSQQYALAATDARRAALLSAGQAMLAVGKSHTPGTFIGFFFSGAAGVLISIVMLRSMVFNKASAYAGILGFSLLLMFDICSSFIPSVSRISLLFALIGGLLSTAWYILIARRLFQLAHSL